MATQKHLRLLATGTKQNIFMTTGITWYLWKKYQHEQKSYWQTPTNNYRTL